MKMKYIGMKILIFCILSAVVVISCSMFDGMVKEDRGTFRGRWYNYYDRGLMSSERSVWQDAERDLQKTISMRPQDQRMARTYGMHFIDYFPHRELGIVYFNKGEIDRAISELELSLSQEESAKAIFYLNKARKQQLINRDIRSAPPMITVSSPPDNEIVNDFTLTIRGTISSEGYVARLMINDVPYRIDLARNTIVFEQPVPINGDIKMITIVAEDLLGNTAEKIVPLKVDREGPAISIFDIAREQSGVDEIIRISGAINDSTGIVRLVLNDKTIDTGGVTSYEFNVVADSKLFVLQAFDRLDNVTTARIDIEKELAAVHEKPAPVLLAFAGTGIFSSDSAPPVITMQESADMPDVFVDRYYVEGEVSDNTQVDSVTVNGRDVLSKKGRKLFFSRLVKLDEGENRIYIEAFDASGNRSEKVFIITRNIPDALQIGSRMSVSVLPFNTQSGASKGEILAYEHLIGSLVNQKRFNVIERAKLEQVLLEQKLTKENLTDPEYSVKVGRLMSSDAIIATSAAMYPRSVEYTSRVINTETSEVMEVRDVYSEDTSTVSIRQMMDGLASKIARSFPLVDGMIIRQDKEYIYVDIGSRSNIKKDMGVIVYRNGNEIRHPLTGKSLGRDMKNLGTASVQEIYDQFSKARLSGKSVSGDIKVQDMVITR